MKYIIEILRQKRNDKTKYKEKYEYENDNLETSLLQVLLDINLKYNSNIEFEYSCYQKKCGACSAIINNSPNLLCKARLKDYKDYIYIEPLRKFNCITDLIVDRSILYENLKTLNLWLNENANINDNNTNLAYKSSECIMCGLCLEVCPSFIFLGHTLTQLNDFEHPLKICLLNNSFILSLVSLSASVIILVVIENDAGPKNLDLILNQK